MQEEKSQPVTIFGRLERLRVVKQLSWDGLAVLLGVNRSFFFHIKAGRTRFSAKALYRLEQAERAAGIEVPVPTVPEALERVQDATDEDLEFYKGQNAAYRLQGLRDRLADLLKALDSEIVFLKTPTVPVAKNGATVREDIEKGKTVGHGK